MNKAIKKDLSLQEKQNVITGNGTARITLRNKLSLSEEAQLITYFEAEKAKVNQSQTKINQVDEEIEGLVRGVYKI